MFAVPDWSISSSDLKRQTEAGSVNGSSKERPDGHTNQPKSRDQKASSRQKRRRGAGQTSVNEETLGQLWTQIIEGKGRNGASVQQPINGRPQGKGNKKRKREVAKDEGSRDHEQLAPLTQGNSPSSQAQTQDVEVQKQTKKNKRKAKDHETSLGQPGSVAGPSTDQAKKVERPTQLSQPAGPASDVRLTPLQASMRQKLISARFRHLNESLYRTSSADSFRRFQESPEMYQEYHEGFRQQVAAWPENPVDGYIRDLERRGRSKPQSKRAQKHKTGGRKHQDMESLGSPRPLPRDSEGVCTVADLGCGDARLARVMEPLRKELRIEVLSYDLQRSSHGDGPSQLVTQADIANLPLRAGAVDVAIFCLALMGTNWIDFVEEAYRILRANGELWIAEIKSRFVGPGPSISSTNPVAPLKKHKKDHKKASTNSTAGGGSGDDDGIDHDGNEAYLVQGLEEAGEDDSSPNHSRRPDAARSKTELAPFIEVLRKRGFVLSSTPTSSSTSRAPPSQAIDMSNKMFVKMEFIKALKPTKGRFAGTDVESRSKTGRIEGIDNNNNHHDRKRAQAKKRRFLDDDDEQEAVEDGKARVGAEGDPSRTSSEAAVLKPCLYKIR